MRVETKLKQQELLIGQCAQLFSVFDGKIHVTVMELWQWPPPISFSIFACTNLHEKTLPKGEGGSWVNTLAGPIPWKVELKLIYNLVDCTHLWIIEINLQNLSQLC
jgi:hypothetical protein